MKDSFQKLYEEDQRHISRWEKHYTDKEFKKINLKIRKKLSKVMNKTPEPTGRQCFIIAMILHHGFNITNSKKALKYAELSVKKGYKKSKWLIASITDRILQLQGKPQKFGTQIIKLKSGKYKQYKLDGTITDKDRKSYGLPKLKELKKYLES